MVFLSVAFCKKQGNSASGNQSFSDTEKILGLLRPSGTLIVAMGGESNEPGEALNSEASAAEKLQRTSFMWNINIERFQKMLLGYNNLGSILTMHGIELQLANLHDSLAFGQRNFYMIKTGQGTTRTAEWMPDTYLYQRLIYRVDKAFAQIMASHGTVPEFWLFFTLGINDMFAGYPSADFKDDMNVILGALHTHYPSMKIILTKFNQPSYTGYNTVIQELDDENSWIWALDAQDAAYAVDNTHWNYTGFKLLGRRVVELIQQN